MRTLFHRMARKAHRDEAGQAALEFLLVIPIFMIMVLLLIDLGLMMYGQVSTANAVREGARYASVNCGDGNCTAGTIAETPAQRAASRSSGWLAAGDITVEWTGSNRGDSVVVRAQKPHNYLFFPYSIDLESCAQMRLEQRDNGTITSTTGATC